MLNCKNIKEKIINYVYSISSQPVVLKDLLEANALYNEKMYVDSGKLGFRINITRAYLVYFIICAIILLPLLAISHYFLEHLDFHVSIVSSVIVTAVVFMGFNFFKAWIRDAITLKRIKHAWLAHFPYFSYEKYSKKVEVIYNEAKKKEIPKKELQQYIIDQLLKES
ncbi:hypothetical protein ACKGJI_03050 [Sulfurospirillum sp. 1307]|jgi:hypothetical protein